MKKIAFFGICGKMGKSMSEGLAKEEDIRIVAGFDKKNIGQDIGLGFEITDDFNKILKSEPDLIIDFTGPDITYKNINWAIENSIDIIVGASGLSKEQIKEIEAKVHEKSSKVFIVPNFSIGAVLMMKLSASVSKYFDGCEIVEMHHDQKKDAPSGTAIATATLISKEKNFSQEKLRVNEKEILEGSRGAFCEGVHIHSIRSPGLLAHQEVIFGTTGQVLKIRHDSLDRSSFYPGLMMSIKGIDRLGSFTYGLECLLEI